MISKNYKKIAIVDIKNLNTEREEGRWLDTTVPVNLSFTPSRVFLNTSYQEYMTDERPVTLDSKTNNTVENSMVLDYYSHQVKMYIKSISKTKIVFSSYEDGSLAGFWIVNSVIAIE